MSIAYELNKSIGKRPCSPGSRAVRCPLVVNGDSEDLLVSNTFGLLKYLRPAIWLTPLLEDAFEGRIFQATTQATARVEFWKKLRSPATVGEREGVQEIDIIIRIREMIILIECKFKSPVHMGRSGSGQRDQLARYLDAAAFNYWPDSGAKREIYLMLLTDTKAEPDILSRYRNPKTVLACVTQARPFVDYERVSEMLARDIGWTTWGSLLQNLENQDPKGLPHVEAMIIADLTKYRRYKLQADQPHSP